MDGKCLFDWLRSIVNGEPDRDSTAVEPDPRSEKAVKAPANELDMGTESTSSKTDSGKE